MSVVVVGQATGPGATRRVEVRGGRITAAGSGLPPREADVEHDGEIAPGLGR